MDADARSPPFFDDNPLVIYEQIMAGRVLFPPHVDAIAKDLIKVRPQRLLSDTADRPQRLLTADLSRRLGNLRGGVSDIKRHPWFEGVSWSAVARREIPVRRSAHPLSSISADACRRRSCRERLRPATRFTSSGTR